MHIPCCSQLSRRSAVQRSLRTVATFSVAADTSIDGFMVMVKIVVMAKIASVWLLVVACQSVPAIGGVVQSHLHLSSTDAKAKGFPAVA